jgi:ABC-2 type transport system ATP-binding protein
VRTVAGPRFRDRHRGAFVTGTAAATPGVAGDAAGQGLELVAVTKRFGTIVALDGVGLSVRPGRVIGFLGPNGAGKTTAMRAIFGLVDPDGGELLWDGRPVGLAERVRFGYMPEERGLYPRMPLGDQLAYFAALHGLSDAAARAATSVWLHRLGLADRASAKVEELSHGNQQRAQLAAAMLHTPDLLVLDEPFAGLDPLAVQNLSQVLRDEAARGAAVLFSSHQLDLVEEVCEDVAIIDHGRVVARGHIDALRQASRRRRLELRLEGAPHDWLPAVPGVQLSERHGGHLRLIARRDVDPQQVLAAAERAARVVEFSFGPPSLAELFLELVAR